MRRIIAALSLLLVCACLQAQPFVIEDFGDPEAIEARKVRCSGDVEYAFADGAITYHTPEGKGAYAVIPLAADLLADNEAWDACNGISFRVRGDGSENWGRIGVGDGQYMYELYFPLADAQWHEVTAHFDELAAAAPVHPLGSFGMLPPSGIRSIQLGDRWYLTWNNTPMPEHSFAIDDLKLIADAPEPPPAPSPRPLEEVLQLLRERKPVRIQCMGDSITAGTGLPDRDTQRYAVLLGQKLRERLGYDEIECYSRAVGGAKLTDARFWSPRDFHGVEPDLVTIAYGYNDKSGGVPVDFFSWEFSDYIDRIARLTGGTAAICPISTLPGGGHRFVMMDDYAQAVRDLAAERGDVACIDLAAQIKPMGRLAWMRYLGDLAHPNIEGHEWLASALADWIVERVEAGG